MAEILAAIVASAELTHRTLRCLQSLVSIKHDIERSLYEAERVGRFLTQLIEILNDPHSRYMPQLLPCALWIAQDCSQTCTKLSDVAREMAAKKRKRLTMLMKLHRIRTELEHQKSIFQFTITILLHMGNQPGNYHDIHRDAAVELDATNVETLIHQAERHGSVRRETEAAEADDQPMGNSISSSSSGSALGTDPDDSTSDIDTSLILHPTSNRTSPDFPSRNDSLLRNQGQQPMAGSSSGPTRSQWMQALVAFLTAIWRENAMVNLVHGPAYPGDNRLWLGNQTQPQPQPPRVGGNPSPEGPLDRQTMQLMASVNHSIMHLCNVQPGSEAYGATTGPRQSPILRGPVPERTHASARVHDDSDTFAVPLPGSVPRNGFPQPSPSQLPPFGRSHDHGNSYAHDGPDATPRGIRWETRQKRHNQTEYKSYVDDRMILRKEYPWDDIVLREVWTSLRRQAVNRDALRRYGFEYQEAGRYMHVFAKLTWNQVRRISYTAGQ